MEIKKIEDKIRCLFPFLVLLLAAMPVSSFTANGTQKTFDFAVTSGKNAEASSSSFKTYTVTGDITSVVNSTNFRTEIGFLRTLPYLDGESCSISIECAGGFCCSNACRSSACPTDVVPPVSAGAAPSGGGGGGGGGCER